LMEFQINKLKEAGEMFTNATILVTGGTGSWGYDLVKKLLTYNPKEIIVYSRNEDKQVNMRREFDDSRLTFSLGDVRDRQALFYAFKGIDYVFHLAALKHVPVCEELPLEAVKTNVIGTQNVIDAAIYNGVKKVINVSTDKAADPANFYGFTKAIGEKLIVHANSLSKDTKFICIRGGNVLATNGSVVNLFIDEINNKNKISITDKRMTRFFLTMEDAINLLLKAASEGIGGEIFVMKMPSCRIMDLAKVLINHFGKKVSIVESGIRPGEKLNEVLLASNEIEDTVEFDKDYLVVLPKIEIKGLREHYSAFPSVKTTSYSSSDKFLTHEEIRKMLVKAKVLK